MGEERLSAGLGLILLQPFPISPHRSSHKAPSTRREKAPPGFRVKYCFGGGLGERPDGQADQALGRAYGKVADLTKLLLPSMPDPLQNCTESLVGHGDF